MKRRRASPVALWASLVLVGFAVLGGAAGAEPTAQRPIAILDVLRVFQEAAAMKAIETAYRAEHRSYAAEIHAEEDELRRAQEQLSRKRGVLTPEAFQAEREKFERRYYRLQELKEEGVRSLNLTRQQGITRVQSVLERIVAEIAEERGLSLILRKEQTVYLATELEITDEVLSRLNAALPSVDAPNAEN